MCNRLMIIAKAPECLVLGTRVPVGAGVPLKGVVYRVVLASEVVVSLSRKSSVRVRKKTQQLQRDRIKRDPGL